MSLTVNIPGAVLDSETAQQIGNIVMTPDIPIIDTGDGTRVVPADNLLAWVATEMGLDPDNLTAEQATGLAEFIHYFTL